MSASNSIPLRSMSPSIRRFLDNGDVVFEVFSHLSLVPSPLTDYNHVKMRIGRKTRIIRRALAAAALTCRSFAEPASRTLWSVLPNGILPLLKVFSCITMKERRSSAMFALPQDMETYYELDGEISSREWVRFTQLASRVRCLNLLICSIEPSVIEVLRSHCEHSGVSLLPNLQILHWPESTGLEPRLRLLKLLCSTSTLSLFEITHGSQYGFTNTVGQDLAMISSTTPGLLHLRSSEHLSAGQSNPILSMRNLKTLNLSTVNLPTFMLLGDLPNLSNLSTRLQSNSQTPDDLSSTLPRGRKGPYKGFPRLRRLETTGSMAELVTMITLISSPRFVALSIHSSAVHTSYIIPRLVKLFTSPAVKNLECLKLYIAFDVKAFRDNSGERMEINFSDLSQSLFPITSLSIVNLHVHTRTISLSDADISRIKSSWPHLTALSVHSVDMRKQVQRVWQPSGVEVIRPSICSLVDLALNRPQLEGLDVEVASITEEDVVRLEERAVAILEEALRSAALDKAAGDSAQSPTLNWLTFARGDYRGDIGLPDDLDRLASVLVRLLPMVGGLGKPIEDDRRYTLSDGTRMFYMWSQADMGNKVFHLLEKLETLKSAAGPFTDYQPFWESAFVYGGFPV